MNKIISWNKLSIAITCVLLVVAVILSGCNSTSTPTSPSAQEPTLEPEPTAAVEALIVPTEGRIGEYITVKVRVIENNICVLSLAQSIEGTTGIVNYKLGQAYPDDDLVVTWYSQIPLDLKPGNYLLRVEQIPLGQVAGDYVLSQGFIVK